MKTDQERQIIAKIADEYRARGYAVTIDPSGADLPRFLMDYRPDLIARGPGENVVLTVKIGTELAQGERLRPIAERVEREPGWRFSLVVVREGEAADLSAEFARPLGIDAIRDRIARAQELTARAQNDAAYLLLSTSLEALMRLISARARLPLNSVPTSTLFRELYSAGEIDRSQYERAMKVLSLRNALVHGLSSSIDAEETRELGSLTRELLGDLSTAA